MRLFHPIILFFFLLSLGAAAQVNPDSLKKRLARARNDSSRVEVLYRAAINKKNPVRLADSLLQALKQYSVSSDCYLRGFVWLKAGTFYISGDNAPKALDMLMRGMRVADSCDSDRLKMLLRGRLAYIYKVNRNFRMSIESAHHSLAYARRLKDSVIMAENFTLLGNMYKTEMLLDSALHYHYAALSIRERRNDTVAIALTYNNLGLAYKNKKEYAKALEFLRNSLDLKLRIRDKTFYSAYNNMAIVFMKLKQYDSAVHYGMKVKAEGIRSKNGHALMEGLEVLAEAYYEKNEVRKALYYYKRINAATDSVNRDELNTQYFELQQKYESERKDAEIKARNDHLKLAEARDSLKNALIAFSCVALLLVMVASVFIYRNYRQSKKSALDLQQKNVLIEQKSKEITDSITYARNIQQSLLTAEQVFKENCRDYFIYNQPRDIVSGDFYWAVKRSDGFMVLCGDCTGHGVPGAFMSLLGISYLNEITSGGSLQMPDAILNELREKIVGNFSNRQNRDGMDAAVILISSGQLFCAGANNPVWVIRDGKCMVIKPDKFPIGKHHGAISPFTLNRMALEKGDLIILLTDGYSDQFGGSENKKYKYRRLQNLVEKNSHLPLHQIRDMLEQAHRDWKGENEQMDDILIMGIRV